MASVKFALVSDVHYDSVKHPRQIDKLNEVVTATNQLGLDFFIQLGDLIDEGWVDSEWDSIAACFNNLNCPMHHVFGNHEYNRWQYEVPKQDIALERWLVKTGYPSSYYSFDMNGYHFVVVDANYNQAGTQFSDHWYDPWLPEAELAWLDNDLRSTALPTYLFMHQRIDGVGSAYIENAAAMRRVLENAGKNRVKAIFTGHDHISGHKLINGVWHHNMDDLLEGSYPYKSYAVVEINEQGEFITGYGSQVPFTPPLPSRRPVRIRDFQTALRFNGVNTRVTVPNGPGLGITGNGMAISAWVKPSIVTAVGNIVDKSNAGIQEGYRLRMSSSGKVALFVAVDGVQKSLESNTILAQDKWQHVVGVVDATEMKIYIDGVEEALTKDISGYTSLTPTTQALNIGDGTAVTGAFGGNIDEVRILSRALSSAEVLDLYKNDIAPSGVAGAWKSDEGSGATVSDSSGNANHGTATRLARITDGTLGPALRFNGVNERVTMPDAPDLDFTGPQLTLSAYIKVSSFAASRNIIDKSNTLITQGFKLRASTTNKLTFFVAIEGEQKRIDSYNLMSADTWYHVVATVTDDNLYLYINGSKEPVVTAKTGNITSSTSPFQVGAQAFGAAPFSGDITKARVWDRALSDAEVAALYSSETVPAPGLVGQWLFDEGSGLDAVDSSGRGNDGRLSFAVFVPGISTGLRRAK